MTASSLEAKLLPKMPGKSRARAEPSHFSGVPWQELAQVGSVGLNASVIALGSSLLDSGRLLRFRNFCRNLTTALEGTGQGMVGGTLTGKSPDGS